MTISDTQRAALERMRDGNGAWTITDFRYEVDNAVVVIKELEKKGFIEKLKCGDARFGSYRITPLGLAAIGKDK